MPLLAPAPNKSISWPISVGAQGIAAAQFARCGFDVLMQAGHDKPWYDLVVTKGGNLLKIAVKGSEDGRWCLAQPYQRAGNISNKFSDGHRAIDLWLDIHGSRTVYCLVQFEDVALNQLPRIYLATPAEIAQRMRESAERLGDPVLYEQYEWIAPETGYTAIEALPSSWLFSEERIHDLVFPQPGQSLYVSTPRKTHFPLEMRPKTPASAAPDPREIILTA
ncbi:MAG TPA: hypothetical protein VGG62_09520 [Terracidiphilus sp.]